MEVWIGTSGWQYRDWRGAFYPDRLRQREWLRHYASRFACVEVNNTFYNLPSEEAVARWRDETPEDFRFILKASRYLTHIRRLRDPRDPVRTMVERFRPLDGRLAVMLLQLPPRFRADIGRLEQTLRAFPREMRIAVEFRDESWFNEDVRALMREHDAALCITDRLNRTAEPEWFDLSWAYLRFHEGDGRPYPCYDDASLRRWASRIAAQRRVDTVYAFFNNDTNCCAPSDAAALADACRERGLEVRRTASRAEVQPVD